MLGYAVAAVPGSSSTRSSPAPTAPPPPRSRAAIAAGRSGSSARPRSAACGWWRSRSCSSACSASARTGSRPPCSASPWSPCTWRCARRSAKLLYPDGRGARGVSRKAKIWLGVGLYLLITIGLLIVLGNEGKNDAFQPQNEFKLDPWIDINIAGIDLSINKAVLYLGARERADDRRDVLHRQPHAARAEQGPDGGRGRLRPDPQQHHRRQHPRRAGWRRSGSRSWPPCSSSSSSRT